MMQHDYAQGQCTACERPHPAVRVLVPARQLRARLSMRQRYGCQDLLRRQLCAMHMTSCPW